MNAKPRDGEANAELIELFHELLKIPKNRIRIVTGLKSRDKVFEIECNAEEHKVFKEITSNSSA